LPGLPFEDIYLNVNIHVGPVIAGEFGPEGDRRFDVIGKSVNIAARLGRRGVTLSPQAFRTLSPEARKKFSKVKPPITYRFEG
jgi:class 3 adenylate cyclase